jgi:hypothetical protein
VPLSIDHTARKGPCRHGNDLLGVFRTAEWEIRSLQRKQKAFWLVLSGPPSEAEVVHRDFRHHTSKKPPPGRFVTWTN